MSVEDYDIATSGEQSMKLSGLLTLFKEHVYKPAIQEIKKAMKSDRKMADDHKTCVDMIVRNIKGEILLLQRSYQDSFEPGKWCLPGGGAKKGEELLDAGIRELAEETHLNVNGGRYIGVVKKPNVTIHYYEVVILEPFYNNEGLLAAPSAICLDNNEHYRYQWVPTNKVLEYDLLLDLKDILSDMLQKITPMEMVAPVKAEDVIWEQWLKTDNDLEDYFALISKAFDDDQISEEQYGEAHDKYMKIKKQNAIKKVQLGFDQGLIDENQYAYLMTVAG